MVVLGRRRFIMSEVPLYRSSIVELLVEIGCRYRALRLESM
jgi:hypothetical protein